MTDVVMLNAQPPGAGTMVGPVQIDSPSLLAARAYEVFFGRAGDVAGLQAWSGALRAGKPLEQVLLEFANSAEFAALYGTQSDEQYVTTLYANAFGRAPDAGGLAFWVDQLAAGTISRGEVATGFYYAPEGVAHFEQLASTGGGLGAGGIGLLPGAAQVTVNPDSANIDASTFNAGSVVIRNTGAQPITQVQIDLSTTALPDLVFDPADGTPAGDSLGKGLQVDGEGGTGVIVPANPNLDPFSEPLANGFSTLTIDFAPGAFQPGEALAFSVDIDPTSIQGQIGSGSVGSVSGLEMTGATVQVIYADGQVQTGQILGDGSPGGGEAHLNAVVGPTPTLSLGGLSGGSSGVLGSPAQALTLAGGLPGSAVQVQVIAGQLGTLNPAQPPIPSNPQFDANTAAAVSYFTTTLDGSGSGSVDISSALTADTDTRYYVTAATLQDIDPVSPGLEVNDLVAGPIVFTIESGPFIA